MDRQRAACLVMLGRFENLAVWCGGGTVPWLTGSLRGRAKDELWLRDVGISMTRCEAVSKAPPTLKL